MLPCLKCGEVKSLNSFYKKRGRPRGYQSYCKDCARLRTKRFRDENLEHCRNKGRELYGKDPKAAIQRVLKSRANNLEKFKAYQRDYSRKNPVKVLAWDRTKAIKRQKRVPAWLTEAQKKQIQEFYWLAKDLRAVSGEEYHVDHIVPLNGKDISGLHVPWNLQILPADLNNKKSNTWSQPSEQ